MLTPLDRARAYAAKVPGAVSGQNGHSTTYDLARVLVHDFALPEHDALQIIAEWNATCSPPWSQRELEHKIRQAASKPHTTPRGAKLDLARNTVSPTGRFIVSRSSAPPADIASGGANPADAIALLKAAFDPEEIVCICTQAAEAEDGKHRPGSHGTFKTAAWFIEQIESGTNPFTAPSAGGRWIRINPYKNGSTTGADQNVASYRHVLIEFDDLPEADQLHILRASNLPLTAIISSGGRSYHGWVRVDAPDRHTWESRRDAIYAYLEDANPCPANKNPGRFSRLPGCERGAQVQRLISGRIGPESWEEFEVWLRRRDLPQGLSIMDVGNVPIAPDPTCILGNRWLCKGGSLVLVSSSGVGKSSFVLQFAVALSTAIPFFGIAHPNRTPLRVGIIQAENDWGDVREALEGALLWLTAAGRNEPGMVQRMADNLRFFRENTKTGAPFLAILRQLIKEHRLEVIVLDPLMAFFGDDVADQKAMSLFLRNTLQPILEETGAVVIIVHHTAKPKQEASRNHSEIAYLGAGSSELTNWAREIAVLQREPNRKEKQGAFLLSLCKRGRRAGLLDDNGNPVTQLRVDHADTGIFWRYATPLPPEPEDTETEKPAGTFTPSRKFKSRAPKRFREQHGE